MNFFIFRKIIIQFTFICIPIIFIFFPIKIVDDTIIAFLKNEYGKDTIKNIVSIGSNLIYITLALAFFFSFRRYNKNRIFTNGEKHGFNIHYIWFFIAGKVLNYGKTELSLVPICLQYKIIINRVFNEFIVNDKNQYLKIEAEKIEVTENNFDIESSELSIILSDTYNMPYANIPNEYRDKPIIVIRRVQNDDNIRTYSPAFVNSIQHIIAKYKNSYETINLFCYTNPQHNLEIANSCFRIANRSKLNKLNVYQSKPITYIFEGEKIEIKL